MPRLTGKELSVHGKKTQFKKGKSGNADSDIKAYSYRHMLRYMAAQPVSGNPKTLQRELQKLYKDATGKSTIARMAAVRAIERMFAKMEPEMFQKVLDNTEGKLQQDVAFVPPTKAPTDSSTVEDAEKAYKEHISR